MCIDLRLSLITICYLAGAWKWYVSALVAICFTDEMKKKIMLGLDLVRTTNSLIYETEDKKN